MSHMEDAILGSLIFQGMYIGALLLRKNQLNHFAQGEYLKYSAWIFVASSFTLNGCCCGIRFSPPDTPNVTL